MRSAYTKFGKNLTDPDSKLNLYVEKSMKVKHEYKTNSPRSGSVNSEIDKESLDKILSGTRFMTMTKKFKDMICALCSTSSQVEMHHIRAAKDVRLKIRTGNSSYAK